jgi:kynureninase
MNFENTFEFAQKLDADDVLKSFRSQFFIPILHGKESIYFRGNSIGLQPRTAQDMVLNEMEDWATYGAEGNQLARNPWLNYHEVFSKKLAPVLGALPEEIIVMNQLTINLHLLLTTFYRPPKKRFKIICEEYSFSSDRFAILSHLELAGYTEEALIIVKAEVGKYTIKDEAIIKAIKDCGEELALVIIGGVSFYTGQLFDLKSITKAAHEVGALCGFDLAHAVGNVPLQLHDWEVDFAFWCSYKYLNGGPGGIGGAFIHQRYTTDTTLPRLAGWWGQNKEKRFDQNSKFNPTLSAEGWQLSGPPILSLSVQRASLDIFEQADFENIIQKGKMLSAYFIFILKEINQAAGRDLVEIITPENEESHGCQISFKVSENGKHFFEIFRKNSILLDWFEPDVIRVAPIPLYNKFEEIYTFGQIFLKNIHPTNLK